MPTVTVGEVELYYEEAGAGEPVLLIMGLGADSNAWIHQVPELSRRYRTVTLDNRGVGRSSKPPGPYSIAQMADEAASVMAHAGLGRAHVVGVSMGGMIAQELAINHPQRVASLVLVNTYAAPTANIEELNQTALAAFGLGGSAGGDEAAPGAIDPMAIFQHMLPILFSERFIRDELFAQVPQLTAGLAYGFSLEAVLAQAAACLAHNATDRLHKITNPTLVLVGTEDRFIPPHHSDALAAGIAGATLVKFEKGTHGMNVEIPEPFNTEVVRFLAAHPFDGRA